MAIPPQHETVPSWRMAQEWWDPASIWEKLPGGESRSPVDSVRRSSSPWAPQQMMVPSVLSPQVWNIPAETWTNGAPESFVVLVPCVVPGSSAGAGGVAALVASRGGVGAGTVGVNAAEAAGVGMGVACSAGCRAGVCSGSASGVGANAESNTPGSVGWPQAASTAASMAAASSTNAARSTTPRIPPGLMARSALAACRLSCSPPPDRHSSQPPPATVSRQPAHLSLHTLSLRPTVRRRGPWSRAGRRTRRTRSGCRAPRSPAGFPPGARQSPARTGPRCCPSPGRRTPLPSR